jgi:type I restriction enzyme S subunit
MYGFTAKAKESGDYRFIRITDITDGGKLWASDAKFVDSTSGATDYLVEPGDLLVARTGATFGKTVLIADAVPAVFASFLIKISVNEDRVLPSFYWHFAQSSAYWKQTENLVSRGGQPQFNANVLKAIKLPIPPLEDQQRIVTILDQFDALVSDLFIGLPAELKARRHQYEYYRDRLLTFREAA